MSVVLTVFAFIAWYTDHGATVLQTASLGMSLACVGLVRYELATGYFPPDHISNFTNQEGIVAVRGTVIRYPDRRVGKLNLTLATEQIYTDQRVQPTHGNILLSLIELDTSFQYGDELVVRGKLRKARDRRNPGEFNYREYLLAKNIHGIMTINNTYQIKKISNNNGSWFLQDLVHPVKSYLEKFIHSRLPPAEAALLSGLIIGERGQIPSELNQAFSKLGVIHILSVSGSHVGFVMLICIGMIGFLRVPHRLRVALTISALFFYAHVANLEPPVVRASLMGGLFLIGTLFERKTDVYNTLALAALFILIVQPLEIFQSSFQLSFSAVASIVYFYPKLRDSTSVKRLYERARDRALLRYSIDMMLVSAAATLGTLPLTVSYFNMLPNYSMPANLVVIPLSFLAMANGLLAALLDLLWPALAELYLAAAWLSLRVMIDLVEWASALPYSQLEIYTFSIWLALGYFLALWLLFNFKLSAARRWSAIYVLCLANIFVWQDSCQNRNELTVTFLDVGQGDAALIRFPDGRHVLIDGGPRGRNSDAGAWVIAPYLKRQGIDEIAALVLSHADADHLGGFPYLMRHFKVREVWDNGQMKDTQLCREYLSLVDSLQITRRALRAGEVLDDFSPVKIFILHPTERFIQDNPSRLNDASLSLKMSYGDIDFIFMGDVEEAGEQALPQFASLLESEVMKVSHHGSRTSNSAQMLTYIRPQVAVISVGELNKFEHPHPEVLTRLHAYKSRVFRTDRDAAVIFTADGKSVKLVRWK